MKVFITGATGFVGTNLVKRLLHTEHTLCCLIRKSTPASEQLKTLGRLSSWEMLPTRRPCFMV